jgi:hypothetical protein
LEYFFAKSTRREGGQGEKYIPLFRSFTFCALGKSWCIINPGEFYRVANGQEHKERRRIKRRQQVSNIILA